MPTNQAKKEAIRAAQAAGMDTPRRIALWAKKHLRIAVSESLVKKVLSTQDNQQEPGLLREEDFTKRDLDYLHDLVNRIGTDSVRIILDVVDQNMMGGPRARRKS